VKGILLIIIFLLSVLSLMTVQVINHEQVHKQIATYYGHKNVTIEMDYLRFSGVTILNEEMLEEEKKLHSYNEIIDYQITGLLIAILMSGFMISLSIKE